MHHSHVPEPHHVILTNDRLEGHEQLVTLRLFWLFSHVYCTVQSLWLFAATAMSETGFLPHTLFSAVF